MLPHALRFAAPAADFICLVKPQFEVGRSDIGKGGIVTDPAARRAALDDLRQTIGQLGLIRKSVSSIRRSRGQGQPRVPSGHVG
ncbi:MAG: hypothetical protein R3C68_10480 [Myxococcota bacterium]